MPATTYVQSTDDFFGKKESALIEVAISPGHERLYLRVPGTSRYICVPLDTSEYEMRTGLEAIAEMVLDEN